METPPTPPWIAHRMQTSWASGCKAGAQMVCLLDIMILYQVTSMAIPREEPRSLGKGSQRLWALRQPTSFWFGNLLVFSLGGRASPHQCPQLLSTLSPSSLLPGLLPESPAQHCPLPPPAPPLALTRPGSSTGLAFPSGIKLIGKKQTHPSLSLLLRVGHKQRQNASHGLVGGAGDK